MFHAGDKANGLVVLAVLFETQGYENPAFDVITDSLSKIPHYQQLTNITEPIQLSRFLPRSFETFYKYTGSLTTPPCSESVIWIIFPEILKIGRNQLQKFRNLDGPEVHKLNIIRDLQELGERQVLISADGHCPAEINKKNDIRVILRS